MRWVVSPAHNGEFVAHMEQVLDVYKRPYDPLRPLICMDETPRQLIREMRPPQPPVDFVCEEDVRRAVGDKRKIVVNASTIITPSARDLGDDKSIFVWESD